MPTTYVYGLLSESSKKMACMHVCCTRVVSENFDYGGGRGSGRRFVLVRRRLALGVAKGGGGGCLSFGFRVF